MLPYVQGITEPVKGGFANFDVKVVMKTYQTTGQLFPKPKDKIELDQVLGPVYSIPGADCSKEYILDETKLQFVTQAGEHKNAVASKQTRKSA